jgi:serine/threonine-protein kinase RsbW/stage II sporulation protein AB (anti-sigma F factor)
VAARERAYTSHAEGRMPEQSSYRPEFNLRSQRDGDRLRIATAGELDLTTTPDLEAALESGAPYTALELDLEGLTFIDSSGLRLLLSERDRANRHGLGFTIRGAKGPVARVFAISGFDTELQPSDLAIPSHPAGDQPAPTGTGDRFNAVYPADPPSVSSIRHSLSEFARGQGVSEEIVSAAGLAVSEATTNAVVHAYADDDEPGAVTVLAGIDEGHLWVTVCDEGRGMRPRPDSPGLGLGLPLIAQMAASFEVHERDPCGTEVRMRFAL